jgi:hypothetical protein
MDLRIGASVMTACTSQTPTIRLTQIRRRLPNGIGRRPVGGYAQRCSPRSRRDAKEGGAPLHETTHRRHAPCPGSRTGRALRDLAHAGFLGIVNWTFLGKEVSFPEAQWGPAIWAIILAAIWIYVAEGFWNLRAYAWTFGIFISIFTIIFGFFALLGVSTTEAESFGWLMAILIFFYLNYPGVRNVFVEHEMSMLTPDQRAAMQKVAERTPRLPPPWPLGCPGASSRRRKLLPAKPDHRAPASTGDPERNETDRRSAGRSLRLERALVQTRRPGRQRVTGGI